jgi:hypothetical protein
MADLYYWNGGANGNWSTAEAWNTSPTGSGTSASHPLTASVTVDLNGKNVTQDVDVTIAEMVAVATPSGSKLIIADSRTLTGNVVASSVYSPLVQVSAGTFTLAGRATSTNSGTCIQAYDAAVIVISKAGNTAVSVTGASNTGCIGFGAGGGTITGNIVVDNSSASASAKGIYVGGGTVVVNGNVSAKSGANMAGIYTANALSDVTVNGTLESDGISRAIFIALGTARWTGARTLAAGKKALLEVTSTGSLILATSAAFLELANSGMLSIVCGLAASVVTADGDMEALIVNQIAAAQATTFNCSVPITNLGDFSTNKTGAYRRLSGGFA